MTMVEKGALDALRMYLLEHFAEDLHAEPDDALTRADLLADPVNVVAFATERLDELRGRRVIAPDEMITKIPPELVLDVAERRTDAHGRVEYEVPVGDGDRLRQRVAKEKAIDLALGLDEGDEEP